MYSPSVQLQSIGIVQNNGERYFDIGGRLMWIGLLRVSERFVLQSVDYFPILSKYS